MTYRLTCDACDFARELERRALAHEHALEHETTYPTHTVRLVEV